MADRRVKCTRKKDHWAGKAYGITHLGGDWGVSTVQDVIRDIEARTHTYYTLEGGRRAEVQVVNGPHGKYVRTVRDNVEVNDLLMLPSCP